MADKYNLKYPNGIEELYKQGSEGHKVVRQRFILNRLEEKRAEERKEFERLNKYSDLTGKAKRIAMLSDRAAELRKDAKSQDQYADMLMRSGHKKNETGLFGAVLPTALQDLALVFQQLLIFKCRTCRSEQKTKSAVKLRFLVICI